MMKGEYPNFANNNFVSMDSRVYAIGYTIIEFMVEKWSMEKVRKLIKEKGNLEVNMIKILDVTPREYEKQWFDFVNDKYLKN